MSNITLKSVKILEHASEETTCYEAIIYVDNKKAGVVSNDGKGGCSCVRLLDKKYQPLLEQKFKVECFCDHTNPKCFSCKGAGEYDAPLEEYLDQLMEKGKQEKVIAKLKKQGRTVVIITSSAIYGLSTTSKDEAAIRKAFEFKCKDPIKEFRFLV